MILLKRVCIYNKNKDMKRLADLYNNTIFEGMIEGFKCVKCGLEATKRCSRCK